MSYLNVLLALLPMLLAGFIFWTISLAKKDVSIVDSLWSLLFIIAAVCFYLLQDITSTRSDLVLLLVTLWGLRLSLYITVRHWGEKEDHRYREIRDNNNPGFKYKSLYLIFGFQTLVAWIIALPLFAAIDSSSPLNVLDMISLVIWLTGMAFETIADQQLHRFKKKPANKGKILVTGLWRYSRHPNYFGECLIWWGFFGFALAAGHAYYTILSPLLMTYFLLKFSGVSLLEKTMKHRPGYESYMQKTNAFVPGFRFQGGSR
jgi:steroid 5-alpha reductase family enzyme